MIVQQAELLTGEQVERVHRASLEILAETGILVRNQKARKRLIRHGCKEGNAEETKSRRGLP